MKFLYLIFFACPRRRFLNVETNHGPWRPVPDVCRILCCNVRVLAWNFSDLSVASSQHDILLCSETLDSDMRHVSDLLVPEFGHSVFLWWGKMPRGRGMATYARDGYRAYTEPKFEGGCCKMFFFCVCGVRQNLYLFSLYRNPDLDDRIFYCFPAGCRAGWGCPCQFPICGWFEWPSSGVDGSPEREWHSDGR